MLGSFGRNDTHQLIRNQRIPVKFQQNADEILIVEQDRHSNKA